MSSREMKEIRLSSGKGIAAKNGDWVAKAFSKNHGALHRQLGIPSGEKIPEAKLEKAEHSQNPTTRKRAQLAENARHFNHK